MMRMDVFQPDDEVQLKTIHSVNDYEFAFPNFMDKFLCAFTVKDHDGNIITGGGVRTICEAVIITDRDVRIESRRRALHKMLDMSKYVTEKYGYDEIHAIVLDDPKWEGHLKKQGFRDSNGKWLVMSIGDKQHG